VGGLADVETVVVGGGPAGATAAADLAAVGRSVLLLERGGRTKPCGGAIPPRLLEEFAVPDHLLVARARAARIVSPREREVDMPVTGGFVGMVDREPFDEWLRERAVTGGAVRQTGTFLRIENEPDGWLAVCYRSDGTVRRVRARSVIGADGALSRVARQRIPGRIPYVFAYHEVVRSPEIGAAFDGSRCDIHYRRALSPDFYGWIFPHGATTSVGTGSAQKGFPLRKAVAELRQIAGLTDVGTVRCEGAPIPMRPLRRWDDGRAVVLAGDAAGVVAPASGEGIYYAMAGGRLAAVAADRFLASGDARELASARRSFMAEHGAVFRALGMMQRFWYANDWLRERFVALCADRDVQRLVWNSYLNKRMSPEPASVYARIAWHNLRTLATHPRA
jgi:geranylgeranyl diphosphate/geranylgeranyl-bacteriochlorophyllide a reductase